MNDKQVLSVRPVPRNLPTEWDGFEEDLSFDGEVPVREYWRILNKYRTLIALSTVVCLVLAFLYTLLATPLYTASSKIRISTYEPVLAKADIEGVFEEKTKEANYLETQIQEIKSFSLADQVLQNETIRSGLFKKSEPGFLASLFGSGGEEKVPESLGLASRYSQPIEQIRGYLETISVSPVRRTSLVNISSTTTQPRLAALIANQHALEYIEWVRENRVEQRSRAVTFLKQQAAELRDRVGELEREIADYAEENSIVALNSSENIVAQRMAQLNQLLTSTTARRIEAERTAEEAAAKLDSGSAGYDDSSLQSMRSELASREAELEELSAKFTDSYPRVRQLKAQVQGLKNSIRDQREQIAQGLESKAEALRQEEARLSEELEQQKSRQFELAKRQVQYNVLNRELESSRELLQNVLRQVKESSLAIEGNPSNVSVVDYAVIPVNPSYPPTLLVILIGGAMGGALGVGLAFFLSYLDNTVRTPEELYELSRLPNLGVVPSFHSEPKTLPSPPKNGAKPPSAEEGASSNGSLPAVGTSRELKPITFLDSPRSLTSEAYRTIRTGLLLSKAGDAPRSVLISSAQSSEGKTTTVLNLAASLASAGGRVIVIDADLRRPSVYKYFELTPGLPGLVDVITGRHEPGEVILENVYRRISIIPSGKLPPNPAELVGSVEMQKLINHLSEQYDYVLIDSPPILPVTDAVILSRFVDGVVMVVKGASTPRRVFMDAKERLAAVGARVFGTVLNDIDLKSGEYHYYNRYYAAYYESEGDSDDEGKKAASA